MAHRIDHTGHPHPSTPAARALCRANGGTGSTAKRGENAPVAKHRGPGLTQPKVPVPQPKKVDTTPTAKNTATSSAPKKTVSDKPIVKPTIKKPDNTTTPLPPAVKPSGPLTSYIPAATSAEMRLNREKGRIQNALRRGASRDFIVAQSKNSPQITNRDIDDILRQYGVPAHVYPRKGSGGSAPDARTVKTTPIGQVNKANPPASVSPPTGTDSEILSRVRERIDVNPKVRDATHRSLEIQEAKVGSRIARIRSITSGITQSKYKAKVNAGTLGICQDGRIELHAHLHDHEAETVRSRGGWFVKGGGTGVEQIITHEMAHALLTEGSMTAFQRGKLKNALVEHLGLTDTIGNRSTIYQGELDRMIKKPDNQKIIKRKVGRYAASHINEFIAETWTDYTLNPAPSAWNKAIGSVLESIIIQGG